MLDFVFSQSQIGKIAKVNRSTISRKIKDLNIKSINELTTNLESNDIGNKVKGKQLYTYYDSNKILHEIMFQNKKLIKNIIVTYNFKGGSTKTTTNLTLCNYYALMGLKVLAIDLDPQAHLTKNLGFNKYTQNYPTLFDVFINNIRPEDCIQNIRPNLDLIPSKIRMTKLDRYFNSETHSREHIIKNALSHIFDKYDLILIDTNPSLSPLNINALFISDFICVPVDTRPNSLESLYDVLDDLEVFIKNYGLQTKYLIIPTFYESKTVTAQETLGAIRHEFGDKVSRTVIRKCEDFNIASRDNTPLYGFAKDKSHAVEDSLDICHEILEYISVKKTNENTIN